MTKITNFYCDESCHLENDGMSVMALGAVWCPASKVHEVSVRLREIKQKHGLKSDFETKWVKVSPAKLTYYLDVLDYFYDDDDLGFRALIIPDKSQLNHLKFSQTHDDWYYKMYFNMLKAVISPSGQNHIYLDYKDTRGGQKVKQLHQVLCSNAYDFSQEVIRRVQIVRSHEVELIQLTDLLLGAVGYANRGLESSPAKVRLVSRMRERSHYHLTRSTLPQEGKTNLFKWTASWSQ